MSTLNNRPEFIFDSVSYKMISKWDVKYSSKGIGVDTDSNSEVQPYECEISSWTNSEGKKQDKDNCSDKDKEKIDSAINLKNNLYKEIGIDDNDVWMYFEWCIKNNVAEIRPDELGF